MSKPKIIDWKHLAADLSINAENYHQDYYDVKKFSGPSLHFHRRALTAPPHEKTEMVYALLVSWGMHRMGGGPQMHEFEIFEASLEEQMSVIASFQNKSIAEITEPEFDRLEPVFQHLNAMRSSKKMVAFSKILAHFLPNLIGPIDNEYTLKFVFGRPRHPEHWEEWEVFKDIHLCLFKAVLSDANFQTTTKPWLHNPAYPWDTSPLKIADNLIIGKMAVNKKQLI